MAKQRKCNDIKNTGYKRNYFISKQEKGAIFLNGAKKKKALEMLELNNWITGLIESLKDLIEFTLQKEKFLKIQEKSWKIGRKDRKIRRPEQEWASTMYWKIPKPRYITIKF